MTDDWKVRLPYDEQSNLLFNLDSNNLFYYGLLINYLHLVVEGRNLLVAYLRSAHIYTQVQALLKDSKEN